MIEALHGYRLIGNGEIDAIHSLILDKVTRKLWVCKQEEVKQSIRQILAMHGCDQDVIEQLDQPILTEDTATILKEAREEFIRKKLLSSRKLH
jgi:hypothetical protein